MYLIEPWHTCARLHRMWDSVALCQSTRLSLLQPGFNPWAAMWESSLLSLQMSGGFPSGFLPPPERFKISSYKPVRVGRVLDLHSGDVKHTFIFILLFYVIGSFHWVFDLRFFLVNLTDNSYQLNSNRVATFRFRLNSLCFPCIFPVFMAIFPVFFST